MISICIPVFNSNIVNMVRELSKQAAELPTATEIRIWDDGSSAEMQETNRQVENFTLVHYHIQAENRGRISSRFALGQLAQYDWLLFLDDDSGILKKDFLQAYYDHIHNPDTIIAGGRKYPEDPPADCRYRLHWKYGRNREGQWHKLNTGNLKGFQSNNFLIHKSAFNALVFPPEMVQYGHEDTLAGMQLESMGKKILHIHNPVLHTRLETADTFIQKSKMAMQNLRLLSSESQLLSQHVRLYRVYRKLKKWKLFFLVRVLNSLLRKGMMYNLHSCSPSLFCFDLYRLGYMDSIFR